MSARPAHGFSLVELAVVLVILSLLLGGLALPFSAQREVQHWRHTEAALSEIREALLGYGALHGHLPCPDLDTAPDAPGYGVAEQSCPTTAREGFLPFKSLGLAEHDAWQRRWHYRVDARFTLPSITLQTSFGTDSLQILNHQGQPLTTSLERPVAIFYSLGPNGLADGENAHFESNGGRYQQGIPTAGFDDQLHWLARPILISRLIAAGRPL